MLLLWWRTDKHLTKAAWFLTINNSNDDRWWIALELYFQVDPQLNIPIYQQLVDKIRAAVKKGDLIPGQKLPTVQELSDRLGVAKGTIKRAYDELEHCGLLEKIQGRGTFVCYQPANSGSRKEQAMAAIDTLLDQLEEMGFSAKEINIFLTLKQRQRSENLSTVKVAVVECNPENLSQISDQLHRVKGIDLYTYLLDNVQAYPYKLDEEIDLIITTAEHAEYLESILPDRRKIIRVALRLSFPTLTEVLKLRMGDRVGVLCYSDRFGDVLYQHCRKHTRKPAFTKPQLFSAQLDMAAYLADKDAVLVPENFEKYCSSEAAEQLHTFAKKCRVICCAYEMDEGSFLFLEEKLQQLRQSKTM